MTLLLSPAEPSNARPLEARLIHEWTKGDLDHVRGDSTSFTVTAAAKTLLDLRGARRVIYVWTGFCPLLLVQDAHQRWIDAGGNLVKVTRRAERLPNSQPIAPDARSEGRSTQDRLEDLQAERLCM